MTAERVDLGSGCSYETCSGDTEWFDALPGTEYTSERDGRRLGKIGVIFYHPLPDGSECGGAISFGRPWPGKGSENEMKRPVWAVHSLNPLDISPSVKCHCGFHGFIKAGRWVPA